MAIHKWGALCVKIFTYSSSLLSIARWIWISEQHFKKGSCDKNYDKDNFLNCDKMTIEQTQNDIPREGGEVATWNTS
jgi:hypothetical protein